jgi:hypothetical protein
MRCRGCEIPWAHKAVVIKKAFTVFFLPLIPLGSTRYYRCERCNLLEKVPFGEDWPRPQMRYQDAIKAGMKIIAEESKNGYGSDKFNK